MANEEAFTLDGLALNDGVTFGVLNVTWPPPQQRQEWIGAADSEAQLLVRDALHENRKVTLRIAVVPQTTMDLALAKIAQVLDKLQKASKYTDGIGLVWTPATSSLSCTFDVLSGQITDLPIDWENGWLAKAPQITVELTCKPYWRGTETLTSTASSSTPFVTLEVAGVAGDVPALGRLIVTDTASQSRRHVEWGLEGPLTYSSSTSLLVDSDSMVTSGFAGTLSTLSGAYDPNAVGVNAISSTTVAGQQFAICGTGNLAHLGSFRVRARINATYGSYVRVSWRVGDGPMTSNAWAQAFVEGQWLDLDLGTITVPAVISGTQRWTGQIEAYHPTLTGGGVHVDYLALVPTSSGYGRARASYAYTPGVIVGYDQFTSTTAGAALTARTAPSGGTWATSGDATDFVFADNFNATTVDGIESIVRSTSVAETSGRFAILGSTNYTDIQADVRARIGSITTGIEQSVIVRWTDSSNYIRMVVPFLVGSGVDSVRIEQVVAGTVTVIAQGSITRAQRTSYRFRLIAYASGRLIGQVRSDDGTTLLAVEGSSTAAATAGTLATGKPGLRDRSTTTGGGNRYFTEYNISTPTAEPIALYSGRNMQIRYDDVFRQDSTGTYTGRPPSYRGARFLVPVGTSRVMVKARRNDIEEAIDDNVTDALQIQIGYTPRGLAVPR